ncbi:hypothetical protein [Cupriavidus pauculus]|uniref:hypothetical protein n=1 Tax=Cupriavidus pauculus TaxID=82633 RepID=UPI001FD22692|nr:hypothetical protein [Cupriavidus pauculus]
MEVVEYKRMVQQGDGNNLWLQRAQWILQAIISGGIGLKVAYLMGVAFNEAYFHVFKVKAFLLPLGNQDPYLGAYSAAVYGLSGWVEYFQSSFIPLVVVCGIASLLWFAPQFIRLMFGVLSETGLDRKGLSKNKRLSSIVQWVVANTFAIFVFFYVPLILLPALIVAPWVGNYAGERAAKAKLEVRASGCEAAAKQNEFCYVLVEKGVEIARGFPLARSESSIALWWKGGVRIEETGGRSLQLLQGE